MKAPVNEAVAKFREENAKYVKGKKNKSKNKSSREDSTLAMLAKFKSKISAVKKLSTYSDDEFIEEEEELSDEKEESTGW